MLLVTRHVVLLIAKCSLHVRYKTNPRPHLHQVNRSIWSWKRAPGRFHKYNRAPFQVTNIAALVAMIATVLCAPVSEAAFFILPTAPMLPPIGHSRFCLRYPDDCKVRGIDFRRRNIALTLRRINELNVINREVNHVIAPERTTDPAITEEWLISPIAGDCKAYAITKRHELLARGWPSRALLLSEVVVPSGEHHLILIVRTKDVDLVLDNLQDAVQPLGAHAEYRWVRIESPQNPKYWTTVQIYQVEETASAMAASGRGGDDGVEGRQARIDRPIEHAPVSRSAALEIDTAPELKTGRSAEYRLEPAGFDRSEVKEGAKLEERPGMALSDIIAEPFILRTVHCKFVVRVTECGRRCTFQRLNADAAVPRPKVTHKENWRPRACA